MTRVVALQPLLVAVRPVRLLVRIRHHFNYALPALVQ